MPEVTVHRKTTGYTYIAGREQRTSLRPGQYRLGSHYIKGNGLEVAWVRVPGIEDIVALVLAPGEPRTWDVSEDADTLDYRR